MEKRIFFTCLSSSLLAFVPIAQAASYPILESTGCATLSGANQPLPGATNLLKVAAAPEDQRKNYGEEIDQERAAAEKKAKRKLKRDAEMTREKEPQRSSGESGYYVLPDGRRVRVPPSQPRRR